MKTMNPIICSSWLSQARGLMFRRKRDLVIVFREPRTVSLHMFFVFYPIDVFLLNEHQKVIEIKRNFQPFTVYRPQHQARYVIETPTLGQEVIVGEIIGLEIKIG